MPKSASCSTLFLNSIAELAVESFSTFSVLLDRGAVDETYGFVGIRISSLSRNSSRFSTNTLLGKRRRTESSGVTFCRKSRSQVEKFH